MQKIIRLNRTVGVTLTRPNDTNAYSAGDVLSDSTSSPTVLTFGNVTKDFNGQAVITEALCIDLANQTTKPDLELWLFDTPPAAENDNGAFAPSNAEMKTLVAVIPFPVANFKIATAGSGASGQVVCDQQSLMIPVNTKTGTNALSGILVVRNAYTPIAQEVFVIRLKVLD